MASTDVSPAKRCLALSQLGRERLTGLTQRYALDVGDRCVLDHHVDALDRSKVVDFAELLGTHFVLPPRRGSPWIRSSTTSQLAHHPGADAMDGLRGGA